MIWAGELILGKNHDFHISWPGGLVVLLRNGFTEMRRNTRSGLQGMGSKFLLVEGWFFVIN